MNQYLKGLGKAVLKDLAETGSSVLEFKKFYQIFVGATLIKEMSCKNRSDTIFLAVKELIEEGLVTDKQDGKKTRVTFKGMWELYKNQGSYVTCQ